MSQMSRQALERLTNDLESWAFEKLSEEDLKEQEASREQEYQPITGVPF